LLISAVLGIHRARVGAQEEEIEDYVGTSEVREMSAHAHGPSGRSVVSMSLRVSAEQSLYGEEAASSDVISAAAEC